MGSGRYNTQGSYNHRVIWQGGSYRLCWTVDRYYKDTRGRFPRRFWRYTNRKGAERFCKKWGVKMPEQE
jgi:hypothetical protein